MWKIDDVEVTMLKINDIEVNIMDFLEHLTEEAHFEQIKKFELQVTYIGLAGLIKQSSVYSHIDGYIATDEQVINFLNTLLETIFSILKSFCINIRHLKINGIAFRFLTEENFKYLGEFLCFPKLDIVDLSNNNFDGLSSDRLKHLFNLHPMYFSKLIFSKNGFKFSPELSEHAKLIQYQQDVVAIPKLELDTNLLVLLNFFRNQSNLTDIDLTGNFFLNWADWQDEKIQLIPYLLGAILLCCFNVKKLKLLDLKVEQFFKKQETEMFATLILNMCSDFENLQEFGGFFNAHSRSSLMHRHKNITSVNLIKLREQIKSTDIIHAVILICQMVKHKLASVPQSVSQKLLREFELKFILSKPLRIGNKIFKFQLSCSNQQFFSLGAVVRHYGFELHDVLPDGDCLFHAIIHQLCLKEEDKYANLTVELLRMKIAEYMMCHQEKYQDFFSKKEDGSVDEEGGNLDKHIDGLLTGSWGGSIDIAAFVDLYNKNVIVISSVFAETEQGHITKFECNDPNGDTIYLAYQGDHYQSLIYTSSGDPSILFDTKSTPNIDIGSDSTKSSIKWLTSLKTLEPNNKACVTLLRTVEDSYKHKQTSKLSFACFDLEEHSHTNDEAMLNIKYFILVSLQLALQEKSNLESINLFVNIPSEKHLHQIIDLYYGIRWGEDKKLLLPLTKIEELIKLSNLLNSTVIEFIVDNKAVIVRPGNQATATFGITVNILNGFPLNSSQSTYNLIEHAEAFVGVTGYEFLVKVIAYGKLAYCQPKIGENILQYDKVLNLCKTICGNDSKIYYFYNMQVPIIRTPFIQNFIISFNKAKKISNCWLSLMNYYNENKADLLRQAQQIADHLTNQANYLQLLQNSTDLVEQSLAKLTLSSQPLIPVVPRPDPASAIISTSSFFCLDFKSKEARSKEAVPLPPTLLATLLLGTKTITEYNKTHIVFFCGLFDKKEQNNRENRIELLVQTKFFILGCLLDAFSKPKSEIANIDILLVDISSEDLKKITNPAFGFSINKEPLIKQTGWSTPEFFPQLTKMNNVLHRIGQSDGTYIDESSSLAAIRIINAPAVAFDNLQSWCWILRRAEPFVGITGNVSLDCGLKYNGKLICYHPGANTSIYYEELLEKCKSKFGEDSAIYKFYLIQLQCVKLHDKYILSDYKGETVFPNRLRIIANSCTALLELYYLKRSDLLEQAIEVNGKDKTKPMTMRLVVR